MNPQTETPATRAEQAAKPAAGHIALVGAGPGDAELLTLRGAALLGQADVVLTFREPPQLARHRKGLLRHCRPETVIVDPDEYGDSGDAFALSKAVQGLRVVRLYPGGPAAERVRAPLSLRPQATRGSSLRLCQGSPRSPRSPPTREPS